MTKYFTLLFITLFFSTITVHSQALWKRVDAGSVSNTARNSSVQKSGSMSFQLDSTILKEKISAIDGKTVKDKGVEITMPNAKGELETFLIWESSNFEPELQAQYPDIRAFAGVGVTDKKASLHFSIAPSGIQTMVLRAGSASEFIESVEGGSLYTLLTNENREQGSLPMICKTEDVVLNNELLSKTAKTVANNKSFKTYRLALSCTAEYTTYYGGTIAAALVGMNATMTRVNGVFGKDLAVKLVLITNNTSIMYTDAKTDPYSDAATGADGDWAQELQTNLTNTIGNSGYDIGHLFGASGGGGNAGCIGCICVAPTTQNPLRKGSAYTSPSDNKPQGDTFDIDFVAHEMGHQLGANHTFSHEIEGSGVNVEPGSGSTIMGYAGITTDYDVQARSDDYFSFASIKQIQVNLSGKSCGTSTTITNSPPTISAGDDYTIPKGTAFILKGTGSDVNGDTVSYTWEENDVASTSSGANSLAVPTKTDGPLFRSLYPSSTAVRYMPSYSSVLANKLSSKWESVPTVGRTLNFVLTGRDNASETTAQTNFDETVITVSGTVGPFAVTSQNTENLGWAQNSTQTITWSVNGSSALAGSATVNIKLSTDGGLTFPTNLVLNTPNDGSETITVPNVIAKSCRILIEPAGNIYYAVNSTAFSIGYAVTSSCSNFSFGTAFAIPEQSTYTTRTISFPSTNDLVADVNFNVNFTHTYLSDVQMEIISPLGTTVKLFDQSCSSTNSTLDLIYDDSGTDLVCGQTTVQTISPYEALAAFNGENPSGTWTFRIRDAFKNDTGTLNAAGMVVCTKAYTTLSTNDLQLTDFAVHPNPNKGIFTVQFTSDSANDVKVFVHDLLGRKLYENSFAAAYLFNETIGLGTVPSGVYLLTVIDGDRKTVKKLVIQK